MRSLVNVSSKVLSSPWVPRAGKALLAVGALVLLALLGAGTFDGWLSPRPAHASSAGLRRFALQPALSSSPRESPTSSAAHGVLAASSSPAAGQVGHGTLRDEQKIILNTASEVELCKLPGVGTKKAQAILALREKLGGRFKRLEDLYRVKGIKRRFLERIKPHVLLDPPADPPAEESEKKEK